MPPLQVVGVCMSSAVVERRGPPGDRYRLSGTERDEDAAT
jgi:hypothetical protein